MGLGGFFKKAVRQVVKPRTLTAISTFGLSEAIRAVPVVGKPVAGAIETGYGLIANYYSGGLYGVAGSLTAKRPPAPTIVELQGGRPMAINLGGILQSVGTIFGGVKNPYFQGVSNVATLASQFLPPRGIPSSPNVPAVRTSAAMPMIRGGAMVARGFFNKFPSLALAIQQLRARGITVKRAQLWSMLKRFGPELLITGGFLTAAAVSELMMAGPGHRRMNPANVKALRRSARRLESFHRLCVRVDSLRSPRRRACKTPARSGQQFVRQG